MDREVVARRHNEMLPAVLLAIMRYVKDALVEKRFESAAGIHSWLFLPDIVWKIASTVIFRQIYVFHRN